MQKLKKKNKDLLIENESLKRQLEEEKMISDNLSFIIDEQEKKIKQFREWAALAPEKIEELYNATIELKERQDRVLLAIEMNGII